MTTAEISNIEKFELHYFFHDDSHEIDAIIRHKCETEVLAFINEIANQFKLEISIEVEPYGEGGFIDKYKLKWKNLETGTKVAVTMGVVTLATNILMNRNPASTTTPEMQKVNDEIAVRTLNRMRREDSIQKIIDTKSQDSITKVNIEKAIDTTKNIEAEKEQTKLPMKKVDIIASNYSSSINITETLQVYEFSKALSALEINPKINRFRSNFFKSLRKSEKITHVSTTPLNESNEPIDTPVTILRENFSQYIIESDELPNETDNEAFIEIISPVLIQGKYKWKGFYKGQSIEFYMKDTVFKQAVLNKQISFTSGICIECILEFKKKMSEIGEINIVGYSVLAVNGYTEAGVRTQIKRKQKKTPNDLPPQANLFDALEDENYDY